MSRTTLYQINSPVRDDAGSLPHFTKTRRQAAALHQQTINLILNEYRTSARPWFVGFSGGKDSSALLKLLYQSLLRAESFHRRVVIVYCDTGVEIPIVVEMVRDTLDRVRAEAENDGLPLDVRVAEPDLGDRFFVKVIGRGYPPPSNKFRWCTDRLRIKPVKRVISSLSDSDESVVLLGLRRGESVERDRTLARHGTHDHYYLRQAHNAGALIFSPIIDYDLEDVWSAIHHGDAPRSIDARRLLSLYRDASGECPIMRDPRGTPCGKGRFGCWTCTVVRQDRATRSLIREGHDHLKPLLEWRDWLVSVRDQDEYRCRRRRNGQRGRGPFTLRARREILDRLLFAQSQTPWALISDEEVAAIDQLWIADAVSPSYSEI